MSHPFCGTEPCVYPHGWADWPGTSMYIRTIIDPSVTHRQACGEAIHRWNEAVGTRFLMVSDKGTNSITFREAKHDQYPFTESPHAAGLAFPGALHPVVYVRSDMGSAAYHEIVNIYAHEIGHVFSLADHPSDGINSVMSYQVSGRWLLGPSREDVLGVASIHNLAKMAVAPQDLEGIDNITGFWHWDRYGDSGWKYWLRHLGQSTLKALVPYETYTVRAKAEGTLGYGRFSLAVMPGFGRWVYL